MSGCQISKYILVYLEKGIKNYKFLIKKSITADA